MPNEMYEALERESLDLTRNLFSRGYRATKAFELPGRVYGPLHPSADRLGICHKFLLRSSLHQSAEPGEVGEDDD